MSTVQRENEIDTGIAKLSGEAALPRVEPEVENISWRGLPEPDRSDPSYFDRPLLHEPVWEWAIPLYYYIGGAAGASLVMGAAAQLDGSGRFDRFIRRTHLAGILGSAASAVLLIHDLGKPSRFHHMLRVFRPTSPMNVGAWILSTIAPSAFVASLLARRRGFAGAFGEISGVASGLAGLGLSTYTGVLVANTAVPLWQESRRILPILFGASAMASAGSLFDLFVEDRAARRITYTFGTLGRAAELAAGFAMERLAARKSPRIAEPFKTGTSGALWRASTILTAGSLIAALLPRRSRHQRVIAGALGTAGSLLLRFAVHHAGIASSRDPRAVFRQQTPALEPQKSPNA